MAVWNEYRATRTAVDRLRNAVIASPDLLNDDPVTSKHLRNAHRNLEGTYIVRLFAAFEAALRSYDRARHDDPTRITDAATMIAKIAGRRGRGIPAEVRERADDVRRLRNYWAHESDESPDPMLNIDEARSRLQAYLSNLPDEWG